ncbi:phage tail protein [Azospirillum isscasi]|uniref:Tail fiber protein n=1 Tax=Azospirillum isscasi TaxID=3053926 RepID=A0ABU0WP09_9PROT|nr:tail fiber protein [Azospirillum isscasi]MDQ2105975.1 tail fiber protein [Azospirillum isscasi]
MDVYIALIFPFAGVFAPQGSAQCWGQEVPVQQNQALFSLISTIYGGTGNPTFKLPDLRGRVMVGSGISPYLNLTLNPAAAGGTAATTLNLVNLPLHTHAASFTPAGGGGSTATINATVQIPLSAGQGASATPTNGANWLGGVKVSDPSAGIDWQTDGPYTNTSPTPTASYLQGSATGNVTLSGGGGVVSVSPGGGQGMPVPISNLQPFLALTMFIVTMGIYPTRD